MPFSHGSPDITGGGGDGNLTAHVYTATPSEQAYTLYLLQTVFGISYDNNNDGNTNNNNDQQQLQQQQQQSIDNFKISGRDAVPFLSKSGITRFILRNVWTLADPNNVGSLTTVQQMHWILRIIALAQHHENGGGGGAEILAKALNDASLSSSSSSGHDQQTTTTPIMDAMKQCLRDTAHHAIPLAVFQGIPVPEGDELKAIYVKYRNNRNNNNNRGCSTSISSNSSVSSYSSGQYASNNYYSMPPSSSNHQQEQQQPQGFATSSTTTSTTTSGHFHHHTQQQQFPPPMASSSAMSIGSTSSSVISSQQQQQQQHLVMSSHSQITDPYHHHHHNHHSGGLGDMNVFAAASAGGAAAAPMMMMKSTMAGSMQQNQNMNHVFGGFTSTPTTCTTSLPEQPSLMSVSDAFGDIVVNTTTTTLVPDLPSLPSYATTNTKISAPSGMDVHDHGGGGGDDDDDDFGDFADASSPEAANTDTITTTTITGNPTDYETPVLSLSSSWDRPAIAAAAAAASAATAASGWDALDALAAAETQQKVATVGLQPHETAPPPPFPLTATLSWDAGISLSSAAAAAAAATVHPPPQPLFQAPVISSSSTAASNSSVASGWTALDALAESSTANQPGLVMSMPATTTITTTIETAPTSSSLPMMDNMNDRVDDDDDDFGDFNSGTSVSAPPPAGEGQGFSHQGHQTLVTPDITGSSSLDVLDLQEEPEKNENDYHTSFLPDAPAPTVSGWGALDALANDVQDAPLPGLSSLSMGAGESLEVKEDHQPSVGIQNSDEDDFSEFVNAGVSEPLPPAKDIGTDETPERVEAEVETNALRGDEEEEFGAFSNDGDTQLPKQVAASAFRSDPISSGEVVAERQVVAGGETEVRGVSFSPVFDTGAGMGGITRPPLPLQGAFNKSDRSDSAYYSARTHSMNSAAMSSEYSLDDFTDAMQSPDDSNITEDKNAKTPEAGTSDAGLLLDSAGSTSPAIETSDDPFAAFDALSAPPPQLPPLSLFTATVPLDTSELNVVHMNLSNDEGDTLDGDLVGMNPSLEMTPQEDDFGSFITHGEGSGSPTAPLSSDKFGPFDSSTDDPNPGGSAASETEITGTLFAQSLEMTNDDMVEASEGTDFGDFVAAPIDAEKMALGDAVACRTTPVSVDVMEEAESNPDMLEISETDDFGDFETAVSQDGEEKPSDTGHLMETPAAVIPEQGAAEASEGTDGFGDFEAAPFDENATQEATVVAAEIPHSTVLASPSSAEAMHDSDEFGDFSGAASSTSTALPPAPATASASGPALESNFAIFDSASAGKDEVIASHTSEGQDDGWDAFQSSLSPDTGHFESPPSPPPDPERDNLLQIREKIVVQSLHLPEGIRRAAGASGEYVDFGDCFDANIGMDFPVSMERKVRMSRCLQLLDEISNHTKLASTYWAEVISTARDELAMGSFLLDEGLSLSAHDQKKVAKPLEGFVFGLGECVRVVRCIAATVGDLLMLDPSALLTIDTWASSWRGIPLLKDALEVEKLWESIRDKSKKMGLGDKQKMSHKLESLVQIRSTRQHGDTNNNSNTPLLCQLSLQPLSLSQDVRSTTKAVVEWDGRHFMACSANFLANKCAFYSVQNS